MTSIINDKDLSGQEIIKHDRSGNKAIMNKTCLRCMAPIDIWMRSPSGQYCWTCVKLGLVTENVTLKCIPEENHFLTPKTVMVWTGSLTAQQQVISNALYKETREHQLVHAVTGAGKTEMLYAVLEKYFQEKKRVAFVAPRIDVVYEISQRLKTVFQVTQSVMTGDIKENLGHQQLTFMTVHQLFKFKNAFDLIIIDECDAFPLYGNSWLQGALQKAIKSNGRFICLTATLPSDLCDMYDIKKENVLKLHRRFHGYPLPNLKIRRCHDWRKKLPMHLIQTLHENEKEAQLPILFFVPEIKDCFALRETVSKVTNQEVQTAFSGDDYRIENIQSFKNGTIRYLVTTILLERGVTFPNIDVVILGADEAVFTTASLIQIAGRCGRAITRPTGNVWVYTNWRMRKITRAYKEIKRMNR